MKKMEYKDIKEFQIAKLSLAEIENKWKGIESDIQEMQDQIWSELEEAECQSALKKLKIVHSKEKQRIRSRMEMFERVQMANMDNSFAALNTRKKSQAQDVGESGSPEEVGGGEEGGGGVITLMRAGYYTIPPAGELVLDQEGRCLVAGFTIGRDGYGNIHYPGNINVAGINLDENVFIQHKEVIVYPDNDDKPPLGEGLNRAAQVTLHKVWPLDKSSGDTIRSPDRLRTMNYEEKLYRASARMGARFIDYRPETGSWVFKVEHFSRYGLDDTDSEDTEFPDNTKKLKTLEKRPEIKSLADAATGQVLDNSAKSIVLSTKAANKDSNETNGDFKVGEETDVEIQTMQKIWNVDPAVTCASVEVEENQPLLYGGTKVLSSKEKLKQTQRVQERRKECVTADYVADEFKEAFKTCCGCPKVATMKTTTITLLLGVLPSLIDLYSDFILGVSCITEGDYSWGGIKCILSLNLLKLWVYFIKGPFTNIRGGSGPAPLPPLSVIVSN